MAAAELFTLPGTSQVLKFPPFNRKPWTPAALAKLPTIRPSELIPCADVRVLPGTSIVLHTHCVSPTALGTTTGAGPEDTTKLTFEPLVTDAPAAGDWLVTWPTATVSLVVGL